MASVVTVGLAWEGVHKFAQGQEKVDLRGLNEYVSLKFKL